MAKFKFRDLDRIESESTFFLLLVTYAICIGFAVVSWIGLVVSNFEPFPFGLPLLFSPALIMVLWKGIERVE